VACEFDTQSHRLTLRSQPFGSHQYILALVLDRTPSLLLVLSHKTVISSHRNFENNPNSLTKPVAMGLGSPGIFDVTAAQIDAHGLFTTRKESIGFRLHIKNIP